MGEVPTKSVWSGNKTTPECGGINRKHSTQGPCVRPARYSDICDIKMNKHAC